MQAFVPESRAGVQVASVAVTQLDWQELEAALRACLLKIQALDASLPPLPAGHSAVLLYSLAAPSLHGISRLHTSSVPFICMCLSGNRYMTAMLSERFAAGCSFQVHAEQCEPFCLPLQTWVATENAGITSHEAAADSSIVPVKSCNVGGHNVRLQMYVKCYGQMH